MAAWDLKAEEIDQIHKSADLRQLRRDRVNAEDVDRQESPLIQTSSRITMSTTHHLFLTVRSLVLKWAMTMY